jgi:hypothetical protein
MRIAIAWGCSTHKAVHSFESVLTNAGRAMPLPKCTSFPYSGLDVATEVSTQR